MSAALLEVNTKSASRSQKNGFIWKPRGLDFETITAEDLALYKRALRWQRKRAAEFLLPDQRVAKCFVTRIQRYVELHYSPKVKRAHYGGLMICGSVWQCPVCAAKITERRRIELEAAKVAGLSFFMVTVTLQHNAKDKLKCLVDDLGKAWRMVTAGRGWQDIKRNNQIVGSVTGREVTYSLDNGWHPHLHILYYSRKPLDTINTDEIRRHVYDRFKVALEKFGRYASAAHGVNVIKGDDLTRDYVAKVGLDDEKQNTWGLAAEITKAAAKVGMTSGDHYTPFQLIDLYISGDRAAGHRFIEYAITMKGKRQLVYSRGLRDLLEIGAEASDQDLAEAQDQEARLFALLSADDWRIILKRGKRSGILEAASSGDIRLFTAYCLALGIVDLPKISPLAATGKAT